MKKESNVARLLRRIFWKRIKADKAVILPLVGEQWRINDADPFPPITVATIIDVQCDWVRFRIGTSGACSDERLPIDQFVSCYRFYK